MLNNNHIKNKLNNGETVLGTWSILPSTEATDIICSAGLDFIIIDSEHGPISFETAQNMAMVCDSRGVSPIMRVPSIDEADILKALDIGMHGIQIPNIETRENIDKSISDILNNIGPTDNISSYKDTFTSPLKEAREQFEKEYLTIQLKKNHGNISKTADFIGMERSALHRKLKQLGIKGIN